MKQFRIPALALFVIITASSCKKDKTEVPEIPKGTSFAIAGDSATVAAKVAEFRIQLGATLNTAPGASSGRREVNWDAVPASFTNNNNFPFDFFAQHDAALPNGRKRGISFSTPLGSQMRVDSTGFTSIDASYANQFSVFSKNRLFAGADHHVVSATFKVPGVNEAATVKGFGVIFSDVDDANSTYIEFYTGTTTLQSLGVYKAPAAAGSKKFSFLGVYFPNDKVTAVKITSGNAKLAAGVKDVTDGGSADLVTMDDFLYDEPVKTQL
jgi:hypothetical protein